MWQSSQKTWLQSLEDSEETIRRRLETLDEKGEQIWTAEVDGKAVAFMLIYFENPPCPPELELKDEWLVIDWFDVHPNFQRRGLGALLLKAAEQIALNKDVSWACTIAAVDNK